MSSKDLATGLDALPRGRSGGVVPKVIKYWGDQPEVLESIRRARRDNGHSAARIAEYLTSQGYPIAEGSIRKWLTSEGIS